MSRLRVTLLPHSGSDHVQQLYTGFHMLKRRGLVDVRQVPTKVVLDRPELPRHLRGARHAHLRAVLGDGTKIHYDAHNSWEIDTEFLEEADVYFKRSYAPRRLASLGLASDKVHALGLNVHVYPDEPDAFALQRSRSLGGARYAMREWARCVPLLDNLHFTPRVRGLEALPDPSAPARILFMAQAWEPVAHPDDLGEKVEERRRITETRAECMRALRAEFGSAFSGGFVRSPFAEAAYPDLVLPDHEASTKRAYLERVREHSICVATTGLHGSMGWKLAEYVGLARAIVSEAVNYDVPGGFAAGSHYLSFRTPDECVQAVGRLVTDAELRARLMLNNARYYHAWLRPDALVLNSLLTALSVRRTS